MRLTNYLLILLLQPASLGFAQVETTDFKRNTVIHVLEKFPTLRTVDLNWEIQGKRNMEVDIGDQTINRQVVYSELFKSSMNLPVYANKRNLFIAVSGLYAQHKYKFEANTEQFITVPTDVDLRYWSGGVNVTRITRMFDKYLTFYGMLNFDGNEQKFHRVRGFATAVMTLKKNVAHSLHVGLIGLIDPSSQIPVLPMIAYERYFVGTPWMLELFFPSRVMLHRSFGENGRMEIGGHIVADRLFQQVEINPLSGTYEMNQVWVKSGVTYEHRWFNHFYMKGRIGISSPINSRFVEMGRGISQYKFEGRPEASYFLNVGLSYNIF